MNRSSFGIVSLLSIAVALPALAQNQPVQVDPRSLQVIGTTPPANNDSTLRELSPEEIPPNLNFYAVDPLYRPGTPLGWATERIDEKLNRGVVALRLDESRVYLSWRLLKSDPANVAFNVYRSSGREGRGTKLNDRPVTTTTDFIDRGAPAGTASSWWVTAVIDGREQLASVRAELPANSPAQQYRSLKLKDDVQSISMAGIGDLDGDGHYDFVVKHPGGGKDPGRVSVSRGTYKFDAYNGKTGAFMWRVDLGWNVDMGIWWTPFVVRDLDGDNKAEVMFRTAPYAATIDEAFPSAKTGNVLEGPEWLAVVDGMTGKEIDKVDWVERRTVQAWGDNTGNRASRHMMGIAYLDGKTPSVLAVRGTYGMMIVDAWTLKNRKLEKVWRWTNERAPFMYQGQGQHSIKVGDIDGDGCDEILNGSLAIDNDGRTMWTTGLGHGDRFYLTDIDPSRPGLEVAYIIEEPHPQLGLNVRDARTGDLLFGAREPNQDNAIDQVAVGDIDPNYPGMEVWANKGLEQLFYSAKGEPIPGDVPPTSELVWWDSDPLREQLVGGGGGGGGRGRGGAEFARIRELRQEREAATGERLAAIDAELQQIQARLEQARAAEPPPGRSIRKWKGDTLTTNIQGGTYQVADIIGDWREEIVTFADGELRIYSTTIPASDRRVCLMQDPIYRHDVTHRTMGYAHVPQVSYYLGVRK